MRLFVRFIGLLFLAAAFAALIIDGTRSIAAGHLDILALGASLARVAPGSLPHLQTFLGRTVPTLWDPVLVTIFMLPSWLVLGVIGLLLFALTRRPPPKIGYSRR